MVGRQGKQVVRGERLEEDGGKSEGSTRKRVYMRDGRVHVHIYVTSMVEDMP